MTPKPEIHPLARTHLRELRERWGVEPTLEEAVWIVALCEKVLNPGIGARAELIGVPARCGASDEWLWPMTVGAGIWFRELACAWWDGDPDRQFWALAFAMAHGRDKAVLAACRTREASAGMIREWSLSLACTREEMEAAVDAVLPPAGRPERKQGAATEGAMDWARLVAELEVSSGIPADRWIWGVSRAHTMQAWHAARQVIAAQGGKSAEGGRSAADEALMDLAAAKDAIIKAHAKEAS